MDKISFRASKSKFRKFDDKPNEEPSESKAAEYKAPAVAEKKTDVRQFKNINEVLTNLKNQLFNSYNIYDISVYLITVSKEYRLNFKKVYGLEISKYLLEKYYGFDCPMICTNAGGLSDNSSHRARLIERYDKYLIITSSSAFEAFKFESELSEIRDKIKIAFDEVMKLV